MKIAVRVSLMRPLEESSGIQGAPGGGGEAFNPFQPPPAPRGSCRARHRPQGAPGAAGGIGAARPWETRDAAGAGPPSPPRPVAFRPPASGRGGGGPHSAGAGVSIPGLSRRGRLVSLGVRPDGTAASGLCLPAAPWSTGSNRRVATG